MKKLAVLFVLILFYCYLPAQETNKDTLRFFNKHSIYINPAKIGGDVIGLTNIWLCGGYRYGIGMYEQIDVCFGGIVYSQSSGGILEISAGRSKGFLSGIEYLRAFNKRFRTYWALNSTMHYTETQRSDIGPSASLYSSNPIINYTVFRTSLALLTKIGYIAKVKGRGQYVDLSLGLGAKYITSQNNLLPGAVLHKNDELEFPYNKVFNYGSGWVLTITLDLKFIKTFQRSNLPKINNSGK